MSLNGVINEIIELLDRNYFKVEYALRECNEAANEQVWMEDAPEEICNVVLQESRYCSQKKITQFG